MQPFVLRAPADVLPPLRERIVEGLRDHGRVAAVSNGDVDEEATSTGAVEYRLDDAGHWSATGEQLDLPSVLDRLAPDVDYTVVTGYRDLRLPLVTVSGTDAADPVATVDPDDPDVEALVDALAGAEPHVTLESLVERAKAAPENDRAGAIATFTGRVRERDDPGDAPTTHLEFEKYEGIAEERRRTLEAELEERDGVFDVRMHHRVGVLESGEDIVFVVVLAGHREEAFRTVEDGINRLKSEVPIFKKEVTTEETFWVHKKS